MNTNISLDRVAGLYDRLGEGKLREMVDRFYDLMDSDPSAKAIRDFHPPDLAESRDKLFWFLTGRFGGPPMYTERRGHPALRARHNPFPIGAAERNQWLSCMDRAVDEVIEQDDDRKDLKGFFRMVADAMQNR